jgi:hypothetical protein
MLKALVNARGGSGSAARELFLFLKRSLTERWSRLPFTFLHSVIKFDRNAPFKRPNVHRSSKKYCLGHLSRGLLFRNEKPRETATPRQQRRHSPFDLLPSFYRSE